MECERGLGSGYGGGREGSCGLLAEGRSWKGRKGMRTGGVPEMEEDFFEGWEQREKRHRQK